MFFVYAYFNPLKPSNLHPLGYEPFYIGKGKGHRHKIHLCESSIKNDPNKHKANTIRKIRSSNLEPIVEILSFFENEVDAFNEEKRLISLYGRADLKNGPLTNMTDGGEGTLNKVITAEYRKKLSDSTKQAIKDGKLAANILAFAHSQKGKKQTAAHVEKRAAQKRGSKLSDETKSKISKSHSIIRQTQEWKSKASLSQLGKKHSREHIEKSIINNPKSQPIEFMGVEYISINQAIRQTGLTPNKIKKHPSFRKIVKQ
jgi:hypothetical protein